MATDKPSTQSNEPTWLGNGDSSPLSSPPSLHTPHTITGAVTTHDSARTETVDGGVVAPNIDAYPHATTTVGTAKESNR